MAGNLKAKVTFLADTKGLLNGVEKVERKFNQLGNALEKHSRKLMGAGLAIGAGLGVAVKVAGDFDQSLRNMASVAAPTVEEFEAIHDMALSLGRESIHGPRKLAEVTYTLASAGMKAAKQMKVLPGIATLAAATQADLGQATELTVGALNSFGYEADQTDRIINAFAATIGMSQANMDRLQGSLKSVAPVAGQLGQEIEDILVPLGALYDANIEATTAGAAFRNILLDLANPTTLLQDLLNKLGLSATDVSSETHTVVGAFDVLRQAGATSTDMMAAFGKESAAVAAVLFGQTTVALEKNREAITGTKAAYAMAKEQAEGFGQILALTKASLEGAGIAIGEVLLPSVKDMAILVTTAAIAFSDLDPKIVEYTVKGTAAVASTALLGGTVGWMLPKLKKFAGFLSLSADKLAYWTLGLTGAKVAAGLAAGSTVLFGAAVVSALKGAQTKVDALARAEGEWATKREAIYAKVRETEDMFAPGSLEYEKRMARLSTKMAELAEAYWDSADRAKAVAEGIEEVGEVALTASERAEALVTSLIDGVTAAFDKVGTAATVARDPMAEFLTTLDDSVPLLEKYDLLMGTLAPKTLAAAEATRTFVGPLAAVGEQITALNDPLITFADEFQAFFAADGPAILNDWMGIAARAFSGMEKMHGGFGKAIKAASMGFLKDSLEMLIRAKAIELAGISITEKGKAIMTGQWWRLPIVAAGYGLAMSGLNQMKSFDESAVVTRGGSLSGNVTVGDVIVSPDALKNFMKGGGGGRSVQVNVTFAGSYVGDSAGFRDDIDYLAERVALQMER